ncbi:MAG: hypothetical protein LQ352_001540 [Teloschistes flavicans]|nr:MAG: hypothetical protein LQ352_001540 [Teloschistes flavicans]
MDFVTLGMFIIDEIHYQPPKEPDFDVMGGGGLYATLGARLFRSPPASSKVGWVVHQGHDFPPKIKDRIRSWNTDCLFVQTPERPTTRAYNRYEAGGYRSFHYSNEKVRINEDSLTAAQLTSKTYHLLCSPDRCIDLVQGISNRRKDLARDPRSDEQVIKALMEDPVFVWEPMPDLCKPSELQKCLDALEYVDVMSPNLDEFCSLLGISIDLDVPSGWDLMRQKCKELLGSVVGGSKIAVVVRLGAKGCYVTQCGRDLHLPAYHEQDTKHRIADPTGGGNTFLGGFCIGFVQSPDANRADRFEEAALYGTVAASFAIEQVGVPVLTHSATGEESWNNVTVKQRLDEYERKVAERNGHALRQ